MNVTLKEEEQDKEENMLNKLPYREGYHHRKKEKQK